MASREASLKITLQPASFQAGLRRMVTMTKTAGTQMGQALKGPMITGLKSAKKEMAGMMSGVKKGLTTIATLGGAVSFIGLAKDAVTMQNTYRNIAFNVNKVAGNSESWESIQKMITESVQKTGRSADDLATAFVKVFEATGSLEYAKISMGIIGTSATATGHSIAALAQTMQLASRKFGVGADQAEEAMARMIEKTGVGGKGIEELTNRFALVAGEAANAGFKGAEGMSQLLGVMMLLDSTVGEKADPALMTMFDTIKGGTSGFIALKKEMRGVKFTADMTAMDKIKATLMSKKGRIKAEMTFTATSRAVYDELAKPFDEAAKRAKAAGLSFKEQMKAGAEAYDKNLADAAKSTMKYSKIQDEATKRIKSDPMVKMSLAVAKLQEAFSSPKMIGALDKLADKMPAVADAMAYALDVIVDNPWETLAALVVGKIALAFASAAIGEAIALGMTKVLASAAAVQAASGAASLAAGGAAKLGLGGAIGAAGTAGGAGAAAVIGTMAAAGLAAGAVGYGVGTLLYKYAGPEAEQEGEFAAERGVTIALASGGIAAESGSLSKMSQAQLQLTQAKKTLEDSASTWNTAVGGIISIATGGEIASAGERRQKQENAIIVQQERLREAMMQLRTNAELAAKAMGQVGYAGSGSTRGPMSAADSAPGAPPAGGPNI